MMDPGSKSIKLFVFVSLLFFIGCSGIKSEFPLQNLFRITSGPWTAGQPEQGADLLVSPFDISPEFESDSFVFRVSRDQYKVDFYNRFMVSPAEMITHSVREDLYASRLFKAVQPGDSLDVQYRLRGKVVELYADIRDPNAPKGVMVLGLTLERQTKAGFAPVVIRTYPAQIPVKTIEAVNFVEAWNQCLGRILSDFYRECASLEALKVQGSPHGNPPDFPRSTLCLGPGDLSKIFSW
ncbi:ABC-type transport auxiliary lipoprotein family protein [Desulfospira joergensenii]|uniref:ABC-type transport auxiliary lipoprotein family protein n=1 Tax=Desulfospira joergensenii TaxID=53329 RepID=UPI0003B48B9F|nr:hypothetical protein [Desulfospira joergensenii]